jgi:hypothetical protein
MEKNSEGIFRRAVFRRASALFSLIGHKEVPHPGRTFGPVWNGVLFLGGVFPERLKPGLILGSALRHG